MVELHKVCVESKFQRLYATPEGGAKRCSVQNQAEYDPDDGMKAGWYGWCGDVEDQSDYVLGPYKGPDEVYAAFERRNAEYIRCSKITLHAGCTGQFPTFIRHPDETKSLPPAQTQESIAANRQRWEEIWARLDENNRRYEEQQRAKGLVD